ncbi:hypothetical protein Clacol_000747 [Clathrus columnatus]|uniref:Mitochondrial intermembrane space import and assembly protein 40 n=1 Tax=Clathrus columnatus TaxID=1419009 RepID=A0AAV4ZXP0_9AGAM|nr:hypothetical protein Clacol_000747 [Clathrus columnatus]
MRPFPRQILRSLPLHRPAYRAYSTWKTETPRNLHLPVIFSGILVVSGYVGWRLTSTQKIALDAPQQRPSHPSTQISAHASAHVDEKEGIPQPQISTDSSENVPETPSPSSDTLPTPSGQDEESEGEGEESQGSSAFNPETGEINWDCPCLGGMAHGPCGLQFREAFSCFVFSEQEPKGIDCIEKFRLMQECFREHPEVYGEELIGDDESEPTSDSPSLPPSADSPPSMETDSSETSSYGHDIPRSLLIIGRYMKNSYFREKLNLYNRRT